MNRWIRAIRNWLILSVIVLGGIVICCIPQLIGFRSWKEFIWSLYAIDVRGKLKENIHVKQIESEWRGYYLSPTGYVAKHAIKLDNGLKMFIIDTGKNSMESDWQILSIGDRLVYKCVVHRWADKKENSFYDRLTISTISISDIHQFFPTINSLTDLIDASEDVYDWIEKLPSVKRPFRIFYSNPDSAPYKIRKSLGKDWNGGPFADIHSDFTYSTTDQSKIIHEYYYNYGLYFQEKKRDLKHIKSASYSFYRMNLDDHHVSDTEDVTAIIPEYYDW